MILSHLILDTKSYNMMSSLMCGKYVMQNLVYHLSSEQGVDFNRGYALHLYQIDSICSAGFKNSVQIILEAIFIVFLSLTMSDQPYINLLDQI